MKITSKVSTTFTFILTLTEGEMKGLDAIAGYGFESFYEVFTNHMGKSYIEPYKEDVKKLFERINTMKSHIAALDKFKKAGVDMAAQLNGYDHD